MRPSLIGDGFSISIIQLKPPCTPHASDWNPHTCWLNPYLHRLQSSTRLKIKYLFHNWSHNVWWHYTTVGPKTGGSIQEVFWGACSSTWESRKNPSQYTVWESRWEWYMGRLGERRRTHHSSRRYHPTEAHMWRNNGRQWETRPHTSSNTGTHVGRQLGNKGRQDLGKADTPSNSGRWTHQSNTGTHLEENERQGETRPREGERTIQAHVGRQGETRPRQDGDPTQQRETRRETRDKTSRRRTHHPTKETRRGTMGD